MMEHGEIYEQNTQRSEKIYLQPNDLPGDDSDHPFITTPYISRVLGADGTGNTKLYQFRVSSILLYWRRWGATSYGARGSHKTQRDDLKMRQPTFLGDRELLCMATTANKCLIIWLFVIGLCKGIPALLCCSLL